MSPEFFPGEFIEVFTVLKVLANKLALCSGTCVATMPIILSPQNQEARTESADHKTLGVYKFVSDWEQ